jgi:hypothetical protein
MAALGVWERAQVSEMGSFWNISVLWYSLPPSHTIPILPHTTVFHQSWVMQGNILKGETENKNEILTLMTKTKISTQDVLQYRHNHY